eukprot:15553041-Heterocapsa_arctica.AAC.1
MPLPCDDARVFAEVEVDVDVKPLGECVDEERWDGAGPVREAGSCGCDAFVGDFRVQGSLVPASGRP